MTAKDQLAEMAASASEKINAAFRHGPKCVCPHCKMGFEGYTLDGHLRYEYRAVLRWFAAEVERRAKIDCNPLGGYPSPAATCPFHIGEAMTELLRELGIDDQLNKRKDSHAQ